MGLQYLYPKPQTQDQQDYDGENYRKVFVQVWQAIFNPAFFSDAQLCLLGPGASAVDYQGTTHTLPAIGALLEIIDGSTTINTGMFVTNISFRRTNQHHVIEVLVTYKSPPDNANTGIWRLSMDCDGEETEEQVYHYADGTLVVNSGGDIYPDGVKRVFYDERFTLSFFTDGVLADTYTPLRGTVSTTDITMTINGIIRVFKAHGLKLKNARWKTSYKQPGAAYHQFSVELELLYRNAIHPVTGDFLGWRALLVDKGYRQFDADGPIKDSAGRYIDGRTGDPITDPIFLDGSGGQLDTWTSPNTLARFFPVTPKMIDPPSDDGGTSDPLADALNHIHTTGIEGV